MSKILRGGSRRTLVLVLVSVIGAVVLGCVITVGVSNTLATVATANRARPTVEPQVQPTYEDSVDDVVALGETGENHAGIEFTVTSVNCDGATEAHDGTSVQFADGEFCTAGVDIANNSASPYLFWETHATAAVEDWLYPVDTVATLWNGKSKKYSDPIAPGSSISTELVFDVPLGGTIDYFEFGQAIVTGLVLVDTSAQFDSDS